MSPLQSLSPAETLGDGELKELSLARKLVLLCIFCLAQFLDAFNGSALYSALPALETSLGMTESQSTWIISAFQLTFASFLLISGRVSDVYNPKVVFIGGLSGIGVISLAAGFVNSKIPMIICRALTGIASSMTIPSALSLIVNAFPDPLQQARAIGVFGGSGGVAIIFGLLFGAMLVEWDSYHWVFWFAAIVALPVAIACVFIIPPQIAKTTDRLEPGASKWRSLDLIGVSILTGIVVLANSFLHRSRFLVVALILFIFAVTSGSTDGWASAMVLAPLVISISMVIAFFYWETLLPVDRAAIPPRTWFYSNFSVLFALGLLPFFWWSTMFLMFTNLWQNIFHWSVISSAIHLFPIGVIAFAASFNGPLSRTFSPKWLILTGLSLCMVATVLVAIGGGKPEDYWPYVFPALVMGTVGLMMAYIQATIAIFRAAPASMAGTVGAIFNSALQCGSAVGLSFITSIEASVEASHGGPQEYTGRAAAFWFLLGIVALEFISVSYFYDRSTDHKPQPTHGDLVCPVQDSPQSGKNLDDGIPVPVL